LLRQGEKTLATWHMNTRFLLAKLPGTEHNRLDWQEPKVATTTKTGNLFAHVEFLENFVPGNQTFLFFI
jgi:hypothetical protein